MKLWTYFTSTPSTPYWRSGNVSLCFVEYPNGTFEWRHVIGGHIHSLTDSVLSPTLVKSWKAKPLPREFWPKWALEMDAYGLDEGL